MRYESFLQFVCTKLLGPAAKHGKSGESYWRCPFHNDKTPSFHTLPSSTRHPDKFNCFGCGKWGDHIDMIAHCFPKLTKRERGDIIDQLWDEFCEATGRENMRAGRSHDETVAERVRRYLSAKQGNSSHFSVVVAEKARDWLTVPEVIRRVMGMTPQELQVLVEAKQIAKKYDLPLSALEMITLPVWQGWHRLVEEEKEFNAV